MQQYHSQTSEPYAGERTYSRTGSAFRKSGLADFIGVDGRSQQGNSYGGLRNTNDRCCRRGQRDRDCRDCRRGRRRRPGVVGMLARFVITLVDEAITEPPKQHQGNRQNRQILYRGNLQNEQGSYDEYSHREQYVRNENFQNNQTIHTVHGEQGIQASPMAGSSMEVYHEDVLPPTYGAAISSSANNRKN